MHELPPIVASFNIPDMGLRFLDARLCSDRDVAASYRVVKAQVEQSKGQVAADKEVIFCEDDPTIEEYRSAELKRVHDSGVRMTNEEFDETGLGVKNDSCPDPRFPDMRFIAYDPLDEVVGAFAVLRLRHLPIVDGIVRASGCPWPQFFRYRGLPIRELWPPIMDFFLDNNLSFQDQDGELDFVEWKMPTDDPRMNFFPTPDPDTEGFNGLREIVLAGRDETTRSGRTRHVRRRGEVYDETD